MNNIIRKLTSRKFLMALVGVVSGLALAFGVEGSEITQIVSAVGGIMAALGSAVAYINGTQPCKEKTAIKCTNGVRYCVPTVLNKDDVFAPQSFKMRVSNVFKKVELAVLADGVKVFGKKTPRRCPR